VLLLLLLLTLSQSVVAAAVAATAASSSRISVALSVVFVKPLKDVGVQLIKNMDLTVSNGWWWYIVVFIEPRNKQQQ
jgi:hypothetical protein